MQLVGKEDHFGPYLVQYRLCSRIQIRYVDFTFPKLGPKGVTCWISGLPLVTVMDITMSPVVVFEGSGMEVLALIDSVLPP